jgi:glycosyltransferase involved in cell wall biosynthesis
MDENKANRPHLCVVLVCRDNLNAVETTMRSLRKLSYLNSTVLIIDSSKDDKIRKSVDRLSLQLRVEYHWVEPKGVYPAMNVGIRQAHEESLIWFLNPGDVLADPNGPERLINLLIETKSNWGFAQARYIDEKDSAKFPSDDADVSQINIFNGRTPISHQTIFAKRKTLVGNGCFDEKLQIASDVEMTFKLSMTTPSFLKEVLVYIEPGGLSARMPFRAIREGLKVRQRNTNMSKMTEYLLLISKLGVLINGVIKRRLANAYHLVRAKIEF